MRLRILSGTTRSAGGLPGPDNGDPGEPAGQGAKVIANEVPAADKAAIPEAVYLLQATVESAFSRNKRLLGETLRSRPDSARAREYPLWMLTQNIMLQAEILIIILIAAGMLK